MATFNPHALGEPGAVNMNWVLNHTDEDGSSKEI